MPSSTLPVRPQHLLLGVMVVCSIISILITLRPFQCPPCATFESARIQALLLSGERLRDCNTQATEKAAVSGQKNNGQKVNQKSHDQNPKKGQIAVKISPPTSQNDEEDRNNNKYNQREVHAILESKNEELSGEQEEEPKTPIELLCRGFKKEQAKRIAALKARCAARRERFARQKHQKDPMYTRKGPSRIYIHRNRSLMWCETPKAMSTSWGRALFALEGRDTGDVNYVWVHLFMQERFEFLAPSTLTMNVFRNVPHFEKDYRKLLFLRDPFQRLHSAYMDKIVRPYLPYHNLIESINRELKCNYLSLESKCFQLLEHAENKRAECRRMITEHGPGVIMESPGLRETITNLLGFDPDPRSFSIEACKHIAMPDCSSRTLLRNCHVNLTAIPSFPDFVRYIIEARDPKYAMDRHWSPVTHNCAPCMMPYTRILRFESMMRDVECTLREIYPPAAYSKLVTPTHYRILNGKLDVLKAQSANETAKPQQHVAPHFNVNEVGALRPRERDYKIVTPGDSLKEHYATLSPTLMQKLWDFYRDDTELLEYTSEPDFGLPKFTALH